MTDCCEKSGELHNDIFWDENNPSKLNLKKYDFLKGLSTFFLVSAIFLITSGVLYLLSILAYTFDTAADVNHSDSLLIAFAKAIAYWFQFVIPSVFLFSNIVSIVLCFWSRKAIAFHRENAVPLSRITLFSCFFSIVSCFISILTLVKFSTLFIPMNFLLSILLIWNAMKFIDTFKSEELKTVFPICYRKKGAATWCALIVVIIVTTALLIPYLFIGSIIIP